MNPFYQALEQGYSEDDILGYISKAIPQFMPMIKKASRTGYNAKEILGFLSQNFDTEDRSNMSESERHAANRRADTERVKYGLKAAATAAVTPLAARAAQGALSRALPSSLTGGVSPSPHSNTQTTPNGIGQNGIASAPTSKTPQAGNIVPSVSSQNPPVSGDNIPQPQAPIQPKGIPNPEEYLKEKGVLEKVQAQLNTGNTPEAIAATIGIKDTTGRLKAQIDPELVSAIDAYAKQKPQEMPEPKLPQSVPVKKVEDVIEPEAPKIEKKSTVATPNGVGEVREIRGDKALVEVDGKIQKMNVDELENPMFSEDDIADAYDNLMSIIPEEHRSGFISWAGYDEDKNVLGFIPRGGKYEELENITPEEAKMIKEGKGVARTTGANREGLWIAGEDTRGGVISQIIHDRRKKKESSEKEQLKFDFNLPKPEKQDRGMKPQFDEMAYARGLSKERERKKKEEEKAKKKKERDEAKKRKK